MFFVLKHASDFYGKNDKLIQLNNISELEKLQKENDNFPLIIDFTQAVTTVMIYDDWIE